MAARGAMAKSIVSKLLLTIFPESFSPDGKEIRIPVKEDGEVIQIKVALTAAKTNIERDGNSSTSSEENPKSEKIPESVREVVKCGPLTDAEKIAILEQLWDIVDVELEPIEEKEAVPF